MENKKTSLQLFDQAILEDRIAWWQMTLPSGDVLFSDSKATMLGRDPKDFKHYTDFTNLLHPDDYEETMQAMKDHLEGKKKFYETKYRIKHNDGSYKTYFDFGQIIKRDEDEMVIVGFVIKVKSDQELEKQVEKLKNLITEGEPSILDLIEEIQHKK